jgi:hypothetical protein
VSDTGVRVDVVSNSGGPAMRTPILIVIAASFFPLTIGAQEPKATPVTPQRVIQVKALFNACARRSVKIQQAGESTYHFKCNEPAARRFGGKLKQMGVNSTHLTGRENNQEGIAFRLGKCDCINWTKEDLIKDVDRWECRFPNLRSC